jgi:hypothetical protein
MRTTPERLAELKALAVDSDLSGIDSITTRLDILHEKDEARCRAFKEHVPDLITDLEEVKSRFNECVGGFKRDLQKKLVDQLRKNNRLTAELTATRKQLEDSKKQVISWSEERRRSSISEAFAKELSSELISTRKQLAEAQALLKRLSPLMINAGYVGANVEIQRALQDARIDLCRLDTPALDAAIAEAINDEKRNPWKLAIVNELITSHILTREYEDNPRKALAALVDYECNVALDPAVSKEAQALIELYRKDAERYRQIFASPPYVYTICVYGAPCIDKATADAFLDQKLTVSNKTISPGDG